MSPDEQRRCLWEGRARQMFAKLKWDTEHGIIDGPTAWKPNVFYSNSGSEWLRIFAEIYLIAFVAGARFERERNCPTQDDPNRGHHEDPRS